MSENALGLFRSMEARGLEPNVINYSAAISACEKKGEWEKALDLFRSMQVQGLKPSVLTYNSVIRACERGGGSGKRHWICIFQCGSSA